MIKYNVELMATEHEYESIDVTLQFLVDLLNDIEEYNIPISRKVLNAIESASNSLSFLWFKEGIGVICDDEELEKELSEML